MVACPLATAAAIPRLYEYTLGFTVPAARADAAATVQASMQGETEVTAGAAHDTETPAVGTSTEGAALSGGRELIGTIVATASAGMAVLASANMEGSW